MEIHKFPPSTFHPQAHLLALNGLGQGAPPISNQGSQVLSAEVALLKLWDQEAEEGSVHPQVFTLSLPAFWCIFMGCSGSLVPKLM